MDVLRLPIGADVTLFDGRGTQARARVVDVTSEQVVFELQESPHDARADSISLTIAVAAPKGSRGDWLVEKCAELGVSRLALIDTQRGEVRPGDGKLDRWRRKAIESAKQSGAASVMEIQAGATIEQILLDRAPGGVAFYGATEGVAPGLHSCLLEASSAESPATACVCVVGPEGGLTVEEIETLQSHGARPMSLGRSTLRVETAAIAAAAIWAEFNSMSKQY